MDNNKPYGQIAIQHVGIFVHNLEESAKWYHDIFGFEIAVARSDEKNPGVFPKSWWLQLGNFYLEMYEIIDARPFDYEDYEFTVGLKHLNFYVENIDKFMEDMYARDDIEILVDNFYDEEHCGIPGGDRAVYMLDNSGMLVEISKVYMRD